MKWKQKATWILRTNLIALVFDTLILFLLSLFLEVEMSTLVESGFFPSILLLNSGALFLAGGLIAMAASLFPSKIREYVFHSREKWSQEGQRKGERRANLYILAGITLFLESLALATLIL
ncbi:MAG: hypothetical protein JSV58_01650 [Candidatus Bathyarchaeota archaeon]|nr:MAG: hypothetical protein JSV58_01650 [Candidatus Bathyarchaeota archaeon]